MIEQLSLGPSTVPAVIAEIVREALLEALVLCGSLQSLAQNLPDEILDTDAFHAIQDPLIFALAPAVGSPEYVRRVLLRFLHGLDDSQVQAILEFQVRRSLV